MSINGVVFFFVKLARVAGLYVRFAGARGHHGGAGEEVPGLREEDWLEVGQRLQGGDAQTSGRTGIVHRRGTALLAPYRIAYLGVLVRGYVSRCNGARTTATTTKARDYDPLLPPGQEAKYAIYLSCLMLPPETLVYSGYLMRLLDSVEYLALELGRWL